MRSGDAKEIRDSWRARRQSFLFCLKLTMGRGARGASVWWSRCWCVYSCLAARRRVPFPFLVHAVESNCSEKQMHSLESGSAFFALTWRVLRFHLSALTLLENLMDSMVRSFVGVPPSGLVCTGNRIRWSAFEAHGVTGKRFQGKSANSNRNFGRRFFSFDEGRGGSGAGAGAVKGFGVRVAGRLWFVSRVSPRVEYAQAMSARGSSARPFALCAPFLFQTRSILLYSSRTKT